MLNIILNALVTLIQWLYNALHVYSVTFIDVLYAEFQTAVPSYNFTPWLTTFDNLNYFFPLSETITYGIGYFGLWTGVFIYRLVKGWIPFISS